MNVQCMNNSTRLWEALAEKGLISPFISWDTLFTEEKVTLNPWSINVHLSHTSKHELSLIPPQFSHPTCSLLVVTFTCFSGGLRSFGALIHALIAWFLSNFDFVSNQKMAGVLMPIHMIRFELLWDVFVCSNAWFFATSAVRRKAYASGALSMWACNGGEACHWRSSSWMDPQWHASSPLWIADPLEWCTIAVGCSIPPVSIEACSWELQVRSFQALIIEKVRSTYCTEMWTSLP